MNFRTTSLVAAAAILGAGSAFAATNRSTADIQAQYAQERADCLNGRNSQGQATCLKEAGAARNEARRGALAREGRPDYRANALARCEAFSAGTAVEECRARVLDPSQVTGSVDGGGILREHVTIVPAPMSAPMPAPR